MIRDEGSRIVVRQHSDQMIRAAILLAVERCGGEITINGNGAFKERALRVAIENGITIRNPELKQRESELCRETDFLHKR